MMSGFCLILFKPNQTGVGEGGGNI